MEAFHGGLPMAEFFMKGDVRGPRERWESISNLLKIGALNTDLKLCTDFRETLNDVAGERPIRLLLSPDIVVIGGRYREWHRFN